MKRVLIAFLLLAPAWAHAGGGKDVYVVQVPHLGKMALIGKNGPDAVNRYVRNTLRGQVFPGDNARLRAWGKQMAARNVKAPTLAAWRGSPDAAISGIELNHIGDLEGNGIQKAHRAAIARGLQRGDTTPLFLPPGISRTDRQKYLRVLAHAELIGGDDTDPALNHEPVTFSNLAELNLVRDRREVGFLKAAIAMGLPIDTICRGTQLLNRALGGSINQDIYKQGLAKFPHSAPGFKPIPLAVTLAPGSRERAELGSDTIAAAPFMHHQSIGRLGRGVVVTGRTADGIVASIEAANGQVRGTQYHPEAALRYKFSRMIFSDIGARARAYRQAHPIE